MVFRILAAALLSCAISGAASAACVPSSSGAIGSPFVTPGVTRLDTQTSDAVKFTGGCIEGPVINNQIFYAPAYKGTVSGVACTWDATHDVGDCINGAIAAASAAGGGVVAIPAGTYGYSTTIAPVGKVRVVGAGGANFAQCATRLNAIAGFAGPAVTIGSDASATIHAGSGVSRMCIDGAGTVTTLMTLRSTQFGLFEDLYLFGLTTTGIDLDVSQTAGQGAMFSEFRNVYIDLSQAASLNANGLVIGSGTSDYNTNHNKFWQFVITYQDGKGIVCGNADGNEFHTRINTTSATPGPSVHLLGHASEVGRTCRSNRFVGEFGNQNIINSHLVADTDTFPSVNNVVFMNHESGAPAAARVGAATLWVNGSNTGYTEVKRVGVGGSVGNNNTVKIYGTTSGSVEVGVPAAAGTTTITLPATTGTALVEASAAWATYTPSITCNAGTITTLGTVAGQYKRLGKTIHIEIQIPITTVGTCTGAIFATLPVTPVSTVGKYHLHGREDASTGLALVGLIDSGTSTNSVLIWKYDGATCAASGAQCNVGGTYQAN